MIKIQSKQKNRYQHQGVIHGCPFGVLFGPARTSCLGQERIGFTGSGAHGS